MQAAAPKTRERHKPETFARISTLLQIHDPGFSGFVYKPLTEEGRAGTIQPENSNAFQYSSRNWLGALYRFDTSVLYLLFSAICRALDSDAQRSRTACVPLLLPPPRGKRGVSYVPPGFTPEPLNYAWTGAAPIVSAASSSLPYAATHAKH